MKNGIRYQIGYFLGGRVGVTTRRRRTLRSRCWRLTHRILTRIGVSR